MPGAIPHTKALIRVCTMTQCRDLADRALTLSSAAAVRELLRDALGERQ